MDIVYATDGSAGAVSAGELLRRFKLTEADHILLLAVTQHGNAAEAGSCFRGPQAALAGTAARIETEVLQGPPAERILARAKERNADLIALGAMGSTNLSRFLMGSVSERVMRHASRPVLVARPRRFDGNTALVAVDASTDAEKALHIASTWPFAAETEFCLATALPSRETVLGAAPFALGALSDNMESILANARHEAEVRLRAAAAEFQQRGRKVRAEILRGDPASALIAAVDRELADLLIIGSHGEHGMQRFLMGSVSEPVVRHAQSSVLVVR